MIKILTATSKSQGDHPGDFHECLDGEPVIFGTDCGCRISTCSCKRQMIGLKSYHGTTTFEVTELTIPRSLYERQIFDYLCEIGMTEIAKLEEVTTLSKQMASDIFYITSQLSLGDIVVRQDDIFSVRKNVKENIRARLRMKLGRMSDAG